MELYKTEDVFMKNMKENFIPPLWIVKIRSQQRLLILFLLGVFISVPSVSAYINPGTASMLWQLMLAVLLSSAYFIHMYWRRIKDAIQKKFSKSDK